MTSLLRRLSAVPRRACHPTGPVPRAGSRVGPRARRVATLSRTYDDAIQLLETLQSNSAIKGLFNPGDASPGPATAPSPASPPPALNDRAIPEMHAWLAKAGIDAATVPFRAIHVAGTKGKGTTAAYASSILRESLKRSGDRVGLYTSPHLVNVRERIYLDGRRIRQDEFARYFFEVWDAVGCAPAEDPGGGGLCADGRVRPFYFRFLTILAFHVFLREGIRDLVVECGIGGEYDATNVLPASAVSASVITHLELDHTAMLGNTLESIAWHKSGIFRRGVPAFTRPQPSAAMEVLRARAMEKGTGLTVISDAEADRWDAPSADPFARDNRSLASAAAHYHLVGTIEPLPARTLTWTRNAIRQCKMRGRAQVVRRGDARLLVDGAHTPESVARIGAWFAGWDERRAKHAGAAARRARRGAAPGDLEVDAEDGEDLVRPRQVLVFNQQERDAKALLEALLLAVPAGTFDEAIFTRNEAEGGGRDDGVQRECAELMGRMSPLGTTVTVCANVGEAMARVDGFDGKSRVLVTGSMYLVGAVLKITEPDPD